MKADIRATPLSAISLQTVRLLAKTLNFLKSEKFCQRLEGTVSQSWDSVRSKKSKISQEAEVTKLDMSGISLPARLCRER